MNNHIALKGRIERLRPLLPQPEATYEILNVKRRWVTAPSPKNTQALELILKDKKNNIYSYLLFDYKNKEEYEDLVLERVYSI